MARCRVDKSLQRVVKDDFAFPLGAYPVEEMSPRAGFTVWFEPADGGDEEDGPAGGLAGPLGGPDTGRDDELGLDEGRDPFPFAGDGEEDDEGGSAGGWEEWPDRYVFDIAITATRLEALCTALFSMLPGRVYPILDVLGHDAYREVDPYVTYELVGQERFIDALRRYRGYFFEDGLVGFGAMSEEPFLYIFVDEHKMVTVRCETNLRARVESVLTAFDLQEVDEVRGADATTHEHRGVLDAPNDRPDLLTAEEIVEDLHEDWGLVLNIPEDGNEDDEGHELGVTGWRCIVRRESVGEPAGAGGGPPPPQAPVAPPPRGVVPASAFRYAEVLLTASSLGRAEELALEAVHELTEIETDSDAEGPVTPRNENTTKEHPRGRRPERSRLAAAEADPDPASEGDDPPSGPESGTGEDADETIVGFDEHVVIAADRLTPEEFREALDDSAGMPTGATLGPQGAAGGSPASQAAPPAPPPIREEKSWWSRWLQ